MVYPTIIPLAKFKGLIPIMIKQTIPVVLNMICYAFLLPFLLPNVYSYHFLSIMLIFGGNMMCFTWKYIISITMKFEFNPFTLEGFAPVLYTIVCLFIGESNTSDAICWVTTAALVIIWGYSLHFVPFTIIQIADHLKIPVFKIRKVD